MNKAIIVDYHPVGVLTDTVKWTETLSKTHRVTLLARCRPGTRPVPVPGVKAHLVSEGKDSLWGKIRSKGTFMAMTLWHLATHRGRVHVVYFPSCIWLKRLLWWRRMNLDVRTLSVREDAAFNAAYDRGILQACHRFDSVSVISTGLRDKMGLPQACILPLGADVISTRPKEHSSASKSLRLLYVGTFTGRHIERTVEAVALFAAAHPDIETTYDIFGRGDGSGSQEADINGTIARHNLQNKVTMHGFATHETIKPYMDKAQVGFSMVPLAEHYRHQPPTKIYEYVLSGIWTIATCTDASTALIDDTNGTLTDDTPQGLAQGLETYLERRDSITDGAVRRSLAHCTWPKVVTRYLVPIIDN